MGIKGRRRFLETGKVFRDGKLVDPAPPPRKLTPEEKEAQLTESMRLLRRLVRPLPYVR